MNEIVGAGPTSSAMNLMHFPSPRMMVLIFKFEEEEGTGFLLNGIGFGNGMHWLGMVLMEGIGGYILVAVKHLDSTAIQTSDSAGIQQQFLVMNHH